MTPKEIKKHKEDIAKLSRIEMAKLWRFAPSGHPYFDLRYAEIHEEFKKRFADLGGFSPEISKQIGWRNPMMCDGKHI